MLFAARPVLAAEIWAAAVHTSRGHCFGNELVQRRRMSLGVLAQVFGSSREDSPDGWGPEWQRAHLALVHTGTRSVLTCLEEVDASARVVPLLDGSVDPATVRVLTEIHFFSWFLISKPLSRRSTALPATARSHTIVDPRELLGVAGLASNAAADPGRATGPWRVYSPADDGRVRPARGTVDPPPRSAVDPGVIPVAVKGMVPTGGSHLVPGWGSSAVVAMTPIRLMGFGTADQGLVTRASWSWVGTGSTNLRREDLWRHGIYEHADRVRLSSPLSPTAPDTRLWRTPWDRAPAVFPAPYIDGSAAPVTTWSELATWSAR